MSEFFIDCPKCENEMGIEGDELPDKACDDFTHECEHCKQPIKLGWYAEIETR